MSRRKIPRRQRRAQRPHAALQPPVAQESGGPSRPGLGALRPDRQAHSAARPRHRRPRPRSSSSATASSEVAGSSRSTRRGSCEEREREADALALTIESRSTRMSAISGQRDTARAAARIAAARIVASRSARRAHRSQVAFTVTARRVRDRPE